MFLKGIKKKFKKKFVSNVETGYVLILKLEEGNMPLFVYHNNIVAHTCAEHLYRILSEFNKVMYIVKDETKNIMESRYSYRAAKALAATGCANDNTINLDSFADDIRIVLDYCMPSCQLENKLCKDDYLSIFAIKSVKMI